MEAVIEKELQKEDFKSPDEIDEFVKKIRNLISDYEQDLYDNEEYDAKHQLRIKKWRSKLYAIFQRKNEIEEQEKIPDVLENTVKILHRQVKKVESNTALLDKGTIKLMGLNYTNKDIDSALLKTKEKIMESKRNENKEVRMILFAFIIFIIICIYVIADKFSVTRLFYK